MEEFNTIEEKWKHLEGQWEERFGKVPDMEAIIFLVGVNEYQGRTPKYKFSKEEKQDLMHVGTCVLMAQYGYFELEYYDKDGWPHFKKLQELHHANLKQQEQLLRTAVIGYFDNKW